MLYRSSTAQAIGMSRRHFLHSIVGTGAATTLFSAAPLRALQMERSRRVVVVTFGGGARDEETFAPEGQQNIPHLLGELVPQGTFFSQVINQGILGHYVATASIVTGVYETFNNFALTPPQNPTIFEYFRKALSRRADDAWVVAPSNGFNCIGASSARSFGPDFGARIVLPKHLLSAALGTQDRKTDINHLLRDNYESPIPEAVSIDPSKLDRIAELLNLSFSEFASHAMSLASPDELSVFIARQLMKQLAPTLLWITLHDIDVAHSGAYSLYIDGIRRSDRLCADLWHAIQELPEYAGRTALFILPDFGRDSDFSATGNGFQHHRSGDALSRTTWMLALGPGIRQNVVVDRPVDSLDLVPTLGKMLGIATPRAAGAPLLEVLR